MNLLTDVLQAQITRLQEEIRGLASWRTGIVQSVDPPTVLFPRDTVATPADSLTQQITPGQVVLTLTLLRRVWIIGVRGGVAPNTITISGVTYQASGYVALPEVPLAVLQTGTGYATINVTLPHTLPTGWTYALTVDRNPMAWPITVNNADGANTAIQRIRLSAPTGTTIAAGARIGWRITRAP